MSLSGLGSSLGQAAVMAASHQQQMQLMKQGQLANISAAQNFIIYQGASSTTPVYFTGTTSTTSSYLSAVGMGSAPSAVIYQALRIIGDQKVLDGDEATISLPDGSIINVAKDGSFTIDDANAQTIYRANRLRDFNPFINVSDRLEEFIDFCGKHGVRQGEMLELPINLFIGWLVVQAAKQDQEPKPDVPLLADLRKCVTPRCPNCGKFTSGVARSHKIEFCAPVCFDKYYTKTMLCLPLPAERVA